MKSQIISRINTAYINKDFLAGIIVLILITYLVYGMAGGLQNRLSQNPLLIAVLFGMFIGNIFKSPKFMKPSIDFTTTYLIKAGVVLVGLQISAQVIVSMGYEPALVAATELASILIIAYFFLMKVMKFDAKLSMLIAAGSAICGAAAVMAVAMIVRSKNNHVTLAVTAITLMGTVQLFLYPLMYQQGFFSEFNDQLFGIFAGAGIFEFAQVYGAAYVISDTAINYATLVKLIKVMLLIPTMFLIGYFYNKNNEKGQNKVKLPVFVLYFILVIAINSVFTINATVKFLLSHLGTFMFLMAMVALGMKTDLRNIMQEYKLGKLAVSAVFIIGVTTAVSYYYTLLTKYSINWWADGSENLVQLKPGVKAEYYDGKTVFSSIGCNKCHVESLPTRNGDSLLLYSDLLIHDMGLELDDKITSGDAIGTDWRTTPLVGIGSRKRFLHDGRAINYRDAIVAHGGEAKIIRDRFIDLPEKKKQDIYRFFDSLL